MNGTNIIRPDFVIVGAPKCGTSSLHVYLARHPQVFMPEKKEIAYFGSDLHKSREIPPEELQGYLAARRPGQFVGMSGVAMFYSQQAAAEIKQFNPDAKIIIMLRNPVEYLYSFHSQHLHSGEDDIEDFKQALDAEEDRKKGLRIPRSNQIREGLYYRHTARFAEHLTRYFDVFGRDRVHVILLDDFSKDTAGCYRDTLKFLGVDAAFTTDFTAVNPNKEARSKALRRTLVTPSPFARNLARVLLPLGPVRRKLRMAMREWNTEFKKRPPMDPEIRKSLQAEYAPEIDRLAALLNRDLSAWHRGNSIRPDGGKVVEPVGASN